MCDVCMMYGDYDDNFGDDVADDDDDADDAVDADNDDDDDDEDDDEGCLFGETRKWCSADCCMRSSFWF